MRRSRWSCRRWRSRHLRPSGTPQKAAAWPRAAAAATAVLLAALALTVPPARWLDVRCDALSLNLCLFAAYATAGLWAAMSSGTGRGVRLAILGASVLAGGSSMPRSSPRASPARSARSIRAPADLARPCDRDQEHPLARRQPAGTGARLRGLRVRGRRGAIRPLAAAADHPARALATAFIALAAVLGCWQFKLMPYACWLAALPLAVWAARLTARPAFGPALRVAAIVLLSQATLEAGFAALVPARSGRSAAPGTTAVSRADPRRPCFRSASIRRLAALPPGLVAADIDLGPYIVALSPHRVVAAPYHRLDKAILANHAILQGTPEEALPRLGALGVSYMALCADLRPMSAPDAGTTFPCASRLLGRRAIASPRRVGLPQAPSIRVWQIVADP